MVVILNSCCHWLAFKLASTPIKVGAQVFWQEPVDAVVTAEAADKALEVGWCAAAVLFEGLWAAAVSAVGAIVLTLPLDGFLT